MQWNHSLDTHKDHLDGGNHSEDECKGTGLPRRVAFLVPSEAANNSGGRRPFTIDDLPLDPIAAYLGGKEESNRTDPTPPTLLELRVPMPLKYDEPFAYSEEMTMYERWYDHSPLWLKWRVPLLPGTGDGSLLGTNPRVLPSPEELKNRYWRAIAVLGSICAFVTLWVTISLLMPRKSIRSRVRTISLVAILV